MSINIIYLIIITILLFISVLIISSRYVTRKHVPTGNSRRGFFIVKDRYQKLFNTDDNDAMNKLLRIKINTHRYIFVHNILLFIGIVLGLLILVTNGNSTFKILFILVFSLYFMFFPREEILGRKTPYKYLLKIYESKHKKNIDFELYKLTLHLKNLAVASNYKEYSSDYVLNSLYKQANQIKPVIGKMISLWNLGQINDAIIFFSDVIDTRVSHELAIILGKLDNLTAKELVIQIDLLLQVVRKERETNRIIANENRSNLIYFSVIATSVVIILNFIVIVYYIEAINNIQFYIN